MKKLLLTGGTGFVARNIKSQLLSQYEVTTLGRKKDNVIQTDLSREVPELPERYDIILHAAGKAHTTPKSEAEIKEYYDVNFQGTCNLCSALEKSGLPQTFIFISTSAVYGCDKGEMIDEYYPLKSKTPYGLSKIKAEDFLIKWSLNHQVRLSIIRPSLIAGPNPPGNLGSMIKGISTGRYFNIAGGFAKKSVLMVNDIARLVPLLEQKSGIYNICSNDNPTFKDLETVICKQLGKKKPISIPLWMAKGLAIIGDKMGRNSPFNKKTLKKMTNSLTFSNEKAKMELGWNPLSVINNFKLK